MTYIETQTMKIIQSFIRQKYFIDKENLLIQNYPPNTGTVPLFSGLISDISQISHKEWFESFNGMDEIHRTDCLLTDPQ